MKIAKLVLTVLLVIVVVLILALVVVWGLRIGSKSTGYSSDRLSPAQEARLKEVVAQPWESLSKKQEARLAAVVSGNAKASSSIGLTVEQQERLIQLKNLSK